MVGENLNDRVMNIKNDTNNIEKMIEEYKPFIPLIVQRHIGKFIELV